MDVNKLEVLKKVGYRVHQCCGFCAHGRFSSDMTMWGTCAKFEYSHLKHTGDKRQMSICRMGQCEADYVPVMDTDLDTRLGTFKQFLRWVRS